MCLMFSSHHLPWINGRQCRRCDENIKPALGLARCIGRWCALKFPRIRSSGPTGHFDLSVFKIHARICQEIGNRPCRFQPFPGLRFPTAVKVPAGHLRNVGIRLHQFAWAIMLSRDHVLQFLRKEGFADNIIALYGELELQRMLNQFFDRALYYALLGYEEAEQCGPKGDLARARDLAISIGLLAEKTGSPEIFED